MNDHNIDPLEQQIAEALDAANIPYRRERDNEAELDFYLSSVDVYVEVKAWHSPRIAAQMSRARNVIAVQGPVAVKLFAGMIRALHTQALVERCIERIDEALTEDGD